jgi:hypothetical protein
MDSEDPDLRTNLALYKSYTLIKKKLQNLVVTVG